MKITAFNGSPRGEKSNTNKLVEAFLEGAAAAGAETQNILLAKHKIKHCLGCFHCWIKDPGTCIIKDDMKELLDLFIASDVVALCSPVYVDAVSGITKTFMDRLIPSVDPCFEFDEAGVGVHKKRQEKLPKFVTISNAGLPEPEQFQVVSLHVRRAARNLQTEVIGEILRGCGPLLEFDHPTVNPLNDSYREFVVKAGREVVETGRISDATAAQLNRQLIPSDMYIINANKYWLKQIERAKREKG